MASQVKGVWKNVLGLLENELTEISFNTWIKTIVPRGMNTKEVTLEVPAEFNKGILESRYSALLQNAFIQATHKEYKIRFVTPNESYDLNDVQVSGAVNGQTEKLVSQLNPRYVFDSFVIGNSNRFAHAASLAVAEAPARAYNPLFIYGGVGLGKTHLMHAIGHYIINQNPSLKVLYVSSERFTNELINAIKDDKNELFRARYRNIDILLIDDIQFIGGKERTQEEFFHTFNALYEANKQIIMSSDRPPRDMTTLEERLRSRFEWGLTADIQSPDLETRIAILQKKAQLEKMVIPNDVMVFIADNIASNIRELEGALNKVIAFSSLTGKDITLDSATEALSEMLAAHSNKVIDCSSIMDAVARFFDVKMADFKSKSRSRDVTYPRQIAMYLCRDMTDLSLPKIGAVFGGRDHTTVMHACDKINEERQNNPDTRRAVEELKRNISG